MQENNLTLRQHHVHVIKLTQHLYIYWTSSVLGEITLSNLFIPPHHLLLLLIHPFIPLQSEEGVLDDERLRLFL